jgi:hypothetical protein
MHISFNTANKFNTEPSFVVVGRAVDGLMSCVGLVSRVIPVAGLF